MPAAGSPPTDLATGEAGEDDVEDVDEAVGDGGEDGPDAVDDGREAGADGGEDLFDLEGTEGVVRYEQCRL